MKVYQKLFEMMDRYKTNAKSIADRQILSDDIEMYILEKYLKIGRNWYDLDIELEICFKDSKRDRIVFDILYFDNGLVNINRFSLLLDDGKPFIKPKKQFNNETEREYNTTILDWYSDKLNREYI